MAFCLQIPEYIVRASKEYAMSNNLGHRGDGSDGNQEQQLVGIIGQNMVGMMLGRGIMEGKSGFDGGSDWNIFGLNFDVKTMGRAVEPKIDFVNNLIESQTHFKPDAYLFLSLNKLKMILSVCGWLPMEEVYSNSILYAKGTERLRNDGTSFQMRADTYEIPNKNLRHKAKSWTELMGEIICYSHEALPT
jgi:hypothetical protein